MRAPVDTIAAPLFPTKLPWVNATGCAGEQIQRGKPMLVEFWDFCRPNSLRTLPYVKAWHERYADAGLRVIGVHCPGFEPSRDEQAVRDGGRAAGDRPSGVDRQRAARCGSDYENEGWPARYLFDGARAAVRVPLRRGRLPETELRDPGAARRRARAAGAAAARGRARRDRCARTTAEQPGAYSGPYEAGGVWAVLDGSGTVRASDGATGARASCRSPRPAPTRCWSTRATPRAS